MKTPRFLGERMVPREDGSMYSVCRELALKLDVRLLRLNDGKQVWCWNIFTEDGEYVIAPRAIASGPRAAAQATERWLVERSELTLKLASKRAA